MSSNKQKFTGKKRNHPEEISESVYAKSDEIRNRYNESHDRRSFQTHSSNMHQNQSYKKYEDIKDQKMIHNHNNFYKKSHYQKNPTNIRPDDNYSVSPSRSPSIRESNYNPNSAGLSDVNDGSENYAKIKYPLEEEENIPVGFGHNVNFHSSFNEVNRRHQVYNKDLHENSNNRRDSRDYSDRNFKKNSVQRNAKNYTNNDDYASRRYIYDNVQKYESKNVNKSYNKYNNDYSPKNNERSNRGKNEANRERIDEYYKKSDDYLKIKSSQYHDQQPNYQRHSNTEKDRNYNLHNDKYSDNNDIDENRRIKAEKERHNDDANLRQKKQYNRRSRSISRSRSKSSHNSLSRSRYDSIGKEYEQFRSRSGSRNRNNVIKRKGRIDSSIQRSPHNSKKTDNNNISLDNKNSGEEVKMKRFNFLMCLPKNYYRFIEKDYGNLYRDIKKKIRELKYLQYTYIVKGFPDNVLRIDANKVSNNAEVLRIVCDFIFKEMRQTYHNMTYLKISILVPSHVVGFIIGIEGKNINKIRDSSGAKIDVFHENINNRYRQIELAGSVSSLASAAEQIYRFVNKYYYHNPNQNENDSKPDNKNNRLQSVKKERDVRSPDEDRKNNYQKNRRERIVLGGDRKRNKEKRQRSNHKDQSIVENNRRDREKRKRRESKDKNSSYNKSRSISRSKSMREPLGDLDLVENNNNNNIIPMNSRLSENIINKENSNFVDEDRLSDIQFGDKISNLPINKSDLGNEIENKMQNNFYNSFETQDNQQVTSITQQLNTTLIDNVNSKSSENSENLIKNTTINSQQPKTNEISNNFKVSNNDQTKIETVVADNFNKIHENSGILYNNQNPNKNDYKGKISIDMIVPSKTLILLKNFQNNIYLEMENKYGCQITKRAEKLTNGEELNILTFYGEPEQNSYALFYLMRHISDIENK